MNDLLKLQSPPNRSLCLANSESTSESGFLGFKSGPTVAPGRTGPRTGPGTESMLGDSCSHWRVSAKASAKSSET